MTASYITLKTIDSWLFKGSGGILNLFQARLLKNQETPVSDERLRILVQCLSKLIQIKADLESKPDLEIMVQDADTLMIRGLEALVEVIKGRSVSFGSFNKAALTELDDAIQRLPKLIAGAIVLNERLGIKSELQIL